MTRARVDTPDGAAIETDDASESARSHHVDAPQPPPRFEVLSRLGRGLQGEVRLAVERERLPRAIALPRLDRTEDGWLTARIAVTGQRRRGRVSFDAAVWRPPERRVRSLLDGGNTEPDVNR